MPNASVLAPLLSLQPIGEDCHTPWKAAARRSAETAHIREQLANAIAADEVADLIQKDWRRNAVAGVSALASREK